MFSSRHSTSSGHSCDATVVANNSAPTSPKKIMGHGEQRISVDGSASSEKSAAGSSQALYSRADRAYKAAERYGWPKLAHKMAEVPEYAAFPRFRDLNTRNLLYYQAEIKFLQTRIMQVEEEESLTMDRYDHLVEDADSEYHELLLKLRELLREYNKALLQYSRVSALPDPEAYNMSSLRKWIMRKDGADGRISGPYGVENTWGDIRDTGVPNNLWVHFRVVLGALLFAKPPRRGNHDLVVTHPEMKIDGLSKWIVYNLAPLYWTWRDRRDLEKLREQNAVLTNGLGTGEQIPNPQVFDAEAQNKEFRTQEKVNIQDTVSSMSESTAVRFTSSLSTVVACLLPVVAIAALTQVKWTRDLLLCITAFAIIFAVGLIALTQGTSSRTEIFAATAAFSAVLVVFISQPAIDIQMPPGSQTPVINL